MAIYEKTNDRERLTLAVGDGRSPVDYGTTVGESNSTLNQSGGGGINHSKSVFDGKVTLTWNDIRVTSPAKKQFFGLKSKPAVEILRGVSGIVPPGSLLAIMGASGSGKTTMLNVLTNRLTDGLVMTGSVLVNGKNLGQKMSALSAYVQQEDLFIGVLTVREHLWFQASLRMDQNVGEDERSARIKEVIRELGLTKCENTIIGVPGVVKSLSGGERKRLSFAAEVLTNPVLLFCDEPTSGLDSFMAESVVTTLRSLAKAGRTIVCTIHQPSSEIFALFDNLLLLAEGKVIYLGSATGAQEYFARNNYFCPQNHNPADFYIRTLAIAPGREIESRQRLERLGKDFEDSEEGRKLSAEITKQSSVQNSDADFKDFSDQSSFKASYLKQFRLVCWRSAVTVFRDKKLVAVRIFQNVFVAILAGIVFLRQPNNQKGVQNIDGALFLMCTNISFSNIFAAVTTFTSEIAMFMREHENGTYRTSVYYIAKSLVDLPIFIIGPIIYTSILYWIVGLRADADSFFICTATAILVTNVVVAFGAVVSAAAGDPDIGAALAGPIAVPFLLFGGYLINTESIPAYFIWLEYMSWFKYGTEIFFINQWHNFGDIECEYPSVNGSVPTRCFKNGQEVLASLSFNYDNLATDFIALAALLVGFRIIGYLFLLLRANPLKKLFLARKSNSKKN